jgi:hypothetical protein
MGDQRRPTIGFWAAVIVTTALILYPLSAGPAAWVAFRFLPVSSIATVDRCYTPVVWLVTRTGPTAAAWRWYIPRWVDWNELVSWGKPVTPTAHPASTPARRGTL